MLPEFDEQSQRRMKKMIHNRGKAIRKHNDENTDSEARHIFREFIPAYVLNRCGYSLKYEIEIDNMTPDWLDPNERLLLESFTFERGGRSPFIKRVSTGIENKCDRYASVIKKHSLSMVVSVYLDFLTCIDFDDCHNHRTSFCELFNRYPSLWGILFFTEKDGGVLIGGQPYDFMCFTTDASLRHGNNWTIKTFNVSD